MSVAGHSIALRLHQIKLVNFLNLVGRIVSPERLRMQKHCSVKSNVGTLSPSGKDEKSSVERIWFSRLPIHQSLAVDHDSLDKGNGAGATRLYAGFDVLSGNLRSQGSIDSL